MQQPEHYWAYVPHDPVQPPRWRIYAPVQPGRSISWGGAPLTIIAAADKEYVERTGELPPKGGTHDHATE